MTVITVDAKRRTKNVSACSFDVFDTFLLRACTTPDGVFERTYELARVSERLPNVSASFIQHRFQAEARARRAAKDRDGCTEVHIADIYAYFPFRLFGLERRALKTFVDIEFHAEVELCRVNPEMIQQYLEMKLDGYRVGFISDTYWDTQQLTRLLRSCSPELTWDFLYASCDHGSSKSDGLFAKYLAEEGVHPASSIHVGDNENADIRGARRHGIGARHYPQASARLASTLQRETAVFELLCPDRPSRLDQGARTLRRMVANQSVEASAGFQLGLNVLGPMLAVFDAFIATIRMRLAQPGAHVALAFLGRDAFLSYRIWQDAQIDDAAYVEINRRVGLLASADTLAPLRELFGNIVKIDAAAFADIVKILPPAVVAFFARYPEGIATGAELSDALPDLIDADRIAEVAAGMRQRLLAYLRSAIRDFDACTDLILVDLGYSASVQKALRRIFDREGITTRIHGAYLLTLDDAFDDIADGDTAEGLISDLVVTPHAKRMMIRNIALLEQMCCSAEGSVRDYEGSEVLRERDPRSATQIALLSEVQNGALGFATEARRLAPRYDLRPYGALDVAAPWTAAVLGRLLLLPDDDEVVLFSGVRHDVNLGTHALAPMLDGGAVKNLVIAQGLPAACAAPAPPMWLAGSFALLSPAHAYLYLLFGVNRLPADVFGEAACGRLAIGLFAADGQASLETVAVYRTGLGDLRLRIPLARGMPVSTIAVPLAKLAGQGVVLGVVVQGGDTAAEAIRSPAATAIPDERLIYAALERNGRHYRALGHDGCLLIPVDPFDVNVAVYTIALHSLSHDRILAMDGAGSGGALCNHPDLQQQPGVPRGVCGPPDRAALAVAAATSNEHDNTCAETNERHPGGFRSSAGVERRPARRRAQPPA